MGRKKVFHSRKKRQRNAKEQILKSAQPHGSPRQHHSVRLIEDFRKSCLSLPDGWSVVQDTEETLTVSHVHLINEQPTLDYTVIISADNTYIVKAYDHIILRSRLPSIAPVKLRTVKQFKDLLTLVETLSMCPGNPDDQFIELAKTKGGKLKNRNGSKNDNHKNKKY